MLVALRLGERWEESLFVVEEEFPNWEELFANNVSGEKSPLTKERFPRDDDDDVASISKPSDVFDVALTSGGDTFDDTSISDEIDASISSDDKGSTKKMLS